MGFKKAKTIFHRGKPNDFEQMVLDCAKNVRLSKRATKLLLYYANCRNGFKPAGSTIEGKTGISAGNMRIVRKELISHGLIGCGEEFGETIIIAWNRIRAFAALEKPLVYEKKNSEKFISVVRKDAFGVRNKRASKKSLLEAGRQYKIPGIDEKNDVFLKFFGNMNEQEYTDLVTSFPGYDRSRQRKLMSDAEYAKYINLKAFRTNTHKEALENEDAGRYENMISYLKAAPLEVPF